MDTTKVIIENWPNDSWIKDWIPIIIAVIALITSIISLHWTRIEYVKSSRPYVWAINYGVIDNDKKTIIQIPFKVGFRVKNSPARIITGNIDILDVSNKIFSEKFEKLIRFPDEASEWSFTIGTEDFNQMMNRPDEMKRNLIRKIKLKYSSIDGGKVYYYELHQKFEPLDNQWSDIYEYAD